MIRSSVLIGLALGLAIACGPTEVFQCGGDGDCADAGVGGTCQANGYCSFPSMACDSGQRYGEFAPPELAGTCVELAGTGSDGPGPGDDTAPTSTSTNPTPPTATGLDESGSTGTGGESTDDRGESTEDGGTTGSTGGSTDTSSACPGGDVLCAGACIDPLVSADFCGAAGDCAGGNAGASCSPSAECTAGTCIDSCENCGFEDGDFSGWTTTDIANPYFDLVVSMGGDMAEDFPSFTTQPTEGSQCAVTGFDGMGPGTIELGQDITLAAAPPAELRFDYRAGWELEMYGAMLDRTLSVQVEPAGGGAPMSTDVILTAPAGNLTTDTGDLVGTVDLSAYAGQTVFIRFVFDVPEDYSGPALAQLDDVRVVPQ